MEGASDVRVMMLSMGGSVVHTKRGSIQFGLPPETIKESLRRGLPVPGIFVIPHEMFHRRTGLNVAEFEFPSYYNFFCLKRRVVLVTFVDVEPRIRMVFRETLLGPEKIDLDAEFSSSIPPLQRPDLIRESLYFQCIGQLTEEEKPLSIDDLVEFVHFDPMGTADLGEGVAIRDAGSSWWVVLEDQKEVARVLKTMRLPSISPTVSTDVVFDPPLFGLTMLGSSHGFDPGGSTTGFVVWCGGRGLLVDPPIYSSAILRQKGIPHRLLEGIILTHVHADHDGGCFQMLLEEKRLMLITTPTIFNSFLRKFCALSGYHADFLRQLMVYQPVVIGEPFQFMGAAFVFHYSLHTIPTVGFQAFYAGRSIAFSGDHLNHPDTFQCLFDKGIVTKERRDFLMNFPWNADVVLHEAGVPPVHTPLSVFLDLPEDVKRRLYLCHCSPKQVSRDSGLRVATEGVENTIRVAVEPPPHATAVQILDLFERIDIFRGFYIDRAREILQFVQEETFHAGDTIIREGDAGIRFRVIVSGVVGIRAPGDAEAESKFYSTGDFFGETSLITGGPTTATVHAVTEVACISFDRNQFLHLLRGTNAVEQLLHLAAIRRDPSWEVLESNSCFKRLSSSQRTSFQTILHTKCVSKNDILWEQGTAPAEVGILVSEGLMELHRFPASHASITEEETTQPSSAKRMRHEESPIFRRGAFLCDVNAMLQGSPPSTTCIAHTDGVVFEIRRDDFRRFLEENPKITLLLMNTRFVD